MTEKEKIEEGNRLIAKFAGWKYHTKEYNWNHSRIDWSSWVDLENVGHKELFFHSSWDWIMPIWVKFKKIWYSSNKKDTKFEGWIDALGYYLLTADQPKSFFERLVYAIQWYNSTTKTND